MVRTDIAAACATRIMTLAVFLALLCIGTGCTSTRPIDLTDAQDRARINERAIRGNVVLSIRNVPTRPVDRLSVAPNTTTWVDRWTQQECSAPTALVEAITFLRDGIGALKGIGIGAFVGAGLGLMTAGSGGSSDVGGIAITFPTSFYVVMFGVTGSMLGLFPGLIHSDRKVFRVTRPAEPSASSRPSDARDVGIIECVEAKPR